MVDAKLKRISRFCCMMIKMKRTKWPNSILYKECRPKTRRYNKITKKRFTMKIRNLFFWQICSLGEKKCNAIKNRKKRESFPKKKILSVCDIREFPVLSTSKRSTSEISIHFYLSSQVFAKLDPGKHFEYKSSTGLI